ncbi:hypothetical protein [Roseomonas xinghualingensis]|uniref:hypothetical protein n=1 Tax=Roseomonas xinghualingensis TaxID=2986475 RepID=UPI0021F21A82|nr:hypothetical protein [Roseomonas sp. SXEYE001]MCV4210169.1 hypothetical protein [Roseomonas sp. SXEYE001]
MTEKHLAKPYYVRAIIDPAPLRRAGRPNEITVVAAKRALGVVPKGSLSPAGEANDNLTWLLNLRGFLCDSSLLDDVVPYRMPAPDSRKGAVELSRQWSADNAPHALCRAFGDELSGWRVEGDCLQFVDSCFAVLWNVEHSARNIAR